MAEKKSKSFFWASYADLMTSLFFVMLMLFVVAFVELNNKNKELKTTITTIQIEKGKLEAQLKKAQEIENATKGLDSEYFEYIGEYKKHKLKIDVNFPTGKSDIKQYVSKSTKQQLLAAGLKAKEFIDSTIVKHPGIQYLLIIEGQASRDNYQHNYELSYERALSLKDYWEKGDKEFNIGPIIFPQENCEVLICGSGDGKQSGTGLMRETNERLNQRFLIHILPKPGVIEKVINQ